MNMSETIQLSPGLVAAYKELLINPKKNGFSFRPITDDNQYLYLGVLPEFKQ